MPKRLFIVGAPKCGTTSLSRWLADHPAFYMSSIKEPHFYNTDMRARRVKTQSEYDALFADAPEETEVLAEASTWYLYSAAAVPSILQAHPDAYFIAMTRDPVEMAISLYHHNRYRLHEPLDTLEAAWAAQESRARGDGLPADCRDPAFLQYRDACALDAQISRLRSLVAPERLLVLRLEDMRGDARREYLRVLNFVGVADDGRVDFPVFNEARRNRSRLIGRLMQTAGRMKQSLGISYRTGFSQLNRARLEKKEVSLEQRAVMEEAFAAMPPNRHDE